MPLDGRARPVPDRAHPFDEAQRVDIPSWAARDRFSLSRRPRIRVRECGRAKRPSRRIVIVVISVPWACDHWRSRVARVARSAGPVPLLRVARRAAPAFGATRRARRLGQRGRWGIRSLEDLQSRVAGGSSLRENLARACLWSNTWERVRVPGALDHGGLHPTLSEFRPVSDPGCARRTEVSNGLGTCCTTRSATYVARIWRRMMHRWPSAVSIRVRSDSGKHEAAPAVVGRFRYQARASPSLCASPAGGRSILSAW